MCRRGQEARGTRRTDLLSVEVELGPMYSYLSYRAGLDSKSKISYWRYFDDNFQGQNGEVARALSKVWLSRCYPQPMPNAMKLSLNG